MPRITAAPTSAARASSPVPRGSARARTASTRSRAGVIRTPSGAGSIRRHPAAGSGAGRATRNAIAITSPGGDSV